MIPAKINPTKRERLLKLWRARLTRIRDEYGLELAMLISIAWLYIFWYGTMDMR